MKSAFERYRPDRAWVPSTVQSTSSQSGRSNPGISTQLFISPRTVEWHLRKVFAKLGISPRKELRAALPDLDLIPLSA